MGVKSILRFICVFFGYGTLTGTWALQCWDNMSQEGRVVKTECEGSCGSENSILGLFNKKVGCWNIHWSDGCKTAGTSCLCACNQPLCNKPDNQMLDNNNNDNNNNNRMIAYQQVLELNECWKGNTGPRFGYMEKVTCSGSCVKKDCGQGCVRHDCSDTVEPDGCTTCGQNTACCFCNAPLCNAGRMPKDYSFRLGHNVLPKQQLIRPGLRRTGSSVKQARFGQKWHNL